MHVERLIFSLRRAAALMLVIAAGGVIAAQERPEGLHVGRWVLAPYFETGFEYDDNVFRRSIDPLGDSLHELTGGVVASLPFRNSLFQVDYEANRREYEDLSFSRDTTQELGVLLHLRFGSSDELKISERYTRGISNLQNVDQGGELVFQGEPFNFNRWEIELSRSVPARQGYLIRVARIDFNFDTDQPVPFFDYRGFESAFEYRQPLSSTRWLFVYHDSRRFNDYRIATPEELGVPFRKEIQDSYQIGLRGLLGGRQPYWLRLGYGELDYERVDVDGFSGLVGSAAMRVNLGQRTRIDLTATRRPLPSSFDTYFLVNEARVQLSRDWLYNSTVGVDVVLGRNGYGAPVPIVGCETTVRRDTRLDFGANVEWKFHPRAAVRLAGSLIRRNSSCEAAEHEANQASAGLRLGW